MAYKPKNFKTTVGGGIGDAYGVFEELAGEMRETADNMENANMGHMPKCEAAAEAADTLEQLSEPDVPGELADDEVECTEMVNKDKRKAISRDMRFCNAKSMLEGIRAHLEEKYDGEAVLETSDTPAQVDAKEGAAEALKEAAEALCSELDEAIGADAEFPGMYG